MNFIKTTLFVLVVFLCSVPLAWATIPWPYVISIDREFVEDVSLFIVPDGSGPPLTQAQDSGGAMIDATISFTLVDEWGFPIADFPGEDMWLDSECDTQVPCPGGFSPDSSSDNSGLVVFSTSLAGGGWTDGATYLYVLGTRALDPWEWPLENEHLPLPLHFNSPDINGDGLVDLVDLGFFATDYYGEYNYRSDFSWDGILNLPDVGRLAQGIGHNCQ